MLTPVVPVWLQENVVRYLPDNVKDALIGVLKPDAATWLGQTHAIIVTATWIIGLVSAAVIVLNRRNVWSDCDPANASSPDRHPRRPGLTCAWSPCRNDPFAHRPRALLDVPRFPNLAL
jgi:hypothetical protein